MQLRDFIAESLKQIIDGVNEARVHAEANGARINPVLQWPRRESGFRTEGNSGSPVEPIEFDVAVTVTEGTQTKGGIGVFTGIVGMGSQGQSDSTNSSISRIKLMVPVVLPSTPLPPRRDA